MLTEEEAGEIFAKLLTRTVERSVRWTQFMDSSYEFDYRTSRFGFFVRSRDADDQSPYVVEIWAYPEGDGSGTKVFEKSSHLAHEVGPLIVDLYEAAKRSALNLDHLKDSILDDLG